MWIIIFFVLPLAGLAYALWHIWCLLPFGAPWRGAIVAMCTLAFLTLFLNFSRLIDRLPLGLASACYETGNSSIFILLYTVMAFLLLDIGRLAHVVPRSWLHANGYTAAALLALMAVTFTYGYFNYRHKVRQPLELATAKDIGRDMKVVMMSDLHLGYHNRRKELARWVDMVNAERPDLILIAGDIVDGSLRPLEEEGMADELRRLDAPVLACPGNHEYIGGMAGAERFMAEAGITLLRDSVATVGRPLAAGSHAGAKPSHGDAGRGKPQPVAACAVAIARTSVGRRLCHSVARHRRDGGAVLVAARRRCCLCRGFGHNARGEGRADTPEGGRLQCQGGPGSILSATVAHGWAGH